MKNLKTVLDWDRFEEPRRTRIYRLLNAASWIACCEMGEAMNSLTAFLDDLKTENPEWFEEIEHLVKNND